MTWDRLLTVNMEMTTYYHAPRVTITSLALLSHTARYYHAPGVSITSLALLSHTARYYHAPGVTITSLALLSHAARYYHVTIIHRAQPLLRVSRCVTCKTIPAGRDVASLLQYFVPSIVYNIYTLYNIYTSVRRTDKDRLVYASAVWR